ncbi:MAG: PorP/SprF family type IX secretion system membrane protein, partial [Bacteroidales bacterium]
NYFLIIIKKYMRIVRFYLSIVSMTVIMGAYSQDWHFSQFDAAPLFYNPALSGNYDGLHRFIGNYKSQWKTYNTFMLSYDKMLAEDKLKLGAGKLGVGFTVLRDQAGETGYNYTLLKISPAYHVPIIPDNIFNLSAGLEFTVMQNGIDNSKIITASNIGETGEITNSGGYNFNTMKITPDVALGINGYSIIDQKYPVNVGVTIHHLLKTGGTITPGTRSNENRRRISLNTNTIINLQEGKQDLLPSLIYTNQYNFNEFLGGTFYRYTIDEWGKGLRALYVGCWWRVGDAVIPGIAFDFPGFQKSHTFNLGISYDITVSSFNEQLKADKSTLGKNSFELSLKYIIRKDEVRVSIPNAANPPVM